MNVIASPSVRQPHQGYQDAASDTKFHDGVMQQQQEEAASDASSSEASAAVKHASDEHDPDHEPEYEHAINDEKFQQTTAGMVYEGKRQLSEEELKQTADLHADADGKWDAEHGGRVDQRVNEGGFSMVTTEQREPRGQEGAFPEASTEGGDGSAVRRRLFIQAPAILHGVGKYPADGATSNIAAVGASASGILVRQGIVYTSVRVTSTGADLTTGLATLQSNFTVKLLPKGTTCSASAQSVMTTGPFNDEIGQATVGTISANEFSNVIFPVSGEFFLCYTRDVASQTYIELSPIIQVIGSQSNVMKFWCSLEIMKQ